LTEIRETVIHV